MCNGLGQGTCMHCVGRWIATAVVSVKKVLFELFSLFLNIIHRDFSTAYIY